MKIDDVRIFVHLGGPHTQNRIYLPNGQLWHKFQSLRGQFNYIDFFSNYLDRIKTGEVRIFVHLGKGRGGLNPKIGIYPETEVLT